MREGANYYEAMGGSLRRRGYPTASVFNWRTPILFQLLAILPSWEVARALLVLLAIAAAGAAAAVLVRYSPAGTVAVAIGASGVVLMMSAPGAVGMAESWAGCLIGLSVSAYSSRRVATGATLAATALFVRELTLPYTLICALIALRRRRTPELMTWLGVWIAYGVFYWVHWTQVAAQQLAGDVSHAGSWVAWGGTGFLLSAVRWQGLLILSPWALTALTLSLITAGVLSWTAPLHVRLTCGLYSLLFLVVGQNFNEYWGLLLWPSWLLAAGYGAQTVLCDTHAVLGSHP
jgi:hypothetical protein